MRESKKQKWANAVQIDLEGDNETCFYCRECDLLVAVGYCRVVVGDRGPYIEFDDDHIALESIRPVLNYHVYFEEFCSCCEHEIFVYHQVKTVSYADYKSDLWYIDPRLVKTDDVGCCYDEEEEESIKDLW